MKLSMEPKLIQNYVTNLLATYIPDERKLHPLDYSLFDKSLQRVENCFSKIKRKYYNENSLLEFDHLNSNHVITLLYFYGNTIWSETGEQVLPTKLFYLNKIMHGLDLFYSVKMPDVFKLIHPVGTVLGNAEYSDYFVAYQNCTVGSDEYTYPKLGKGVLLYSGSSILGGCKINDNVVFAAKSMIVNTDIPTSTLVTGKYPNHKLHKNKKSVIERQF